jgi:hypothetical protein
MQIPFVILPALNLHMHVCSTFGPSSLIGSRQRAAGRSLQSFGYVSQLAGWVRALPGGYARTSSCWPQFKSVSKLARTWFYLQLTGSYTIKMNQPCDLPGTFQVHQQRSQCHVGLHWGGGCKCTHKNQDFAYNWLNFTMQTPSNLNIKQAWTPTGGSFAPSTTFLLESVMRYNFISTTYVTIYHKFGHIYTKNQPASSRREPIFTTAGVENNLMLTYVTVLIMCTALIFR